MTTSEQLLTEALGLYCLEQPQAELIRHNENMTYKITDMDTNYVLRIHKSIEGFSADIYNRNYDHIEMVLNELAVISSLKNGTALPVQTPVRGRNGGLVQVLTDSTPVTLLEWVEGITVESTGVTPEIAKDSGKMMAEMHMHLSKEAETGKQYVRYDYDQSILPGIAERIEHAACFGAITPEQARTIIKSLDETRQRFDELDHIQEKHIVHADLGKSNIIIGKDGRLTPIDFSLCGYSHFYMDIAGIFGLNHNDENRKHIIEGYKSVCNREIIPRYIEPYLALGVVLFIACQYERAREWEWFPGNMERWCRDIFQPLVDRQAFILT